MFLPTLLAACLSAGGPPASWTGFRGDGSSISAAQDLPLKWSPTENRAWVTALPGYGQSSPVVWGDRAFVTAIDGAFLIRTGTELYCIRQPESKK